MSSCTYRANLSSEKDEKSHANDPRTEPGTNIAPDSNTTVYNQVLQSHDRSYDVEDFDVLQSGKDAEKFQHSGIHID